MKNLNSLNKTIYSFCFILLGLAGMQAQNSSAMIGEGNTVIWKGGTPGRETSWNEPRNWSTYQVPDESSQVIIKALHTGHHAQPVINDEIEVASIEVQTGGSLTITKTGKIVIDGVYQYTQGIINRGGSIVNEGQISLIHVDGFQLQNCQITHSGNGKIILDNKDLTDAEVFADNPTGN